jgi:hypothetical protein
MGFDPDAFLDDLPEGTWKSVLFCVEGELTVCNRWLVASKLQDAASVEIEHLIPGG